MPTPQEGQEQQVEQVQQPSAPETTQATQHTNLSQEVAAETASSQAQERRDQFLSGLRERGINLDGVEDDAGAYNAIQRLHQEYQQLQQMRPWAESYVQNYDDFNKYLQSKKQPAPPQATQQAWYQEFWNPPEFNPAWRDMVEVRNGQLVAKPGYPPNIPQKFLEYAAWQEQQERKWKENPFTFVEPAVRKLASEMAQQEIQKHLGGYKDQQFAQTFAQNNAWWLYQKGQDGNYMVQPQFNPQTGMMEQRPVLSDWGQMLLQEVMREAKRQEGRGYQDIQEQQQRAMERVQLQFLMAQMAGKQPPQQQASQQKNPREAANEEFHQSAAGRVPRGRPTRNIAEPPQKPTSLKEELMANFKAAGVSFGSDEAA